MKTFLLLLVDGDELSEHEELLFSSHVILQKHCLHKAINLGSTVAWSVSFML